MAFTMRPNPHGFDRLDALRDLGRPAIRLHPRRVPALPPNVSKIGGTILWPANERLPICASERCPAVPVLQLFRTDVPLLPFPGQCDLFQLLWYPQMYDDCGYMPKLDLRWWDSRTLNGFVEPDYVNHDPSFVVEECRIFPEEFVEYPYSDQLTSDQWEAIDVSYDEYVNLWSTCPGTKVGGYPDYGGQDSWVPVDSTGREMRFLLTLSDSEWDRSSAPRWMPIEQDHPPFGRLVPEETTDEDGQSITRIHTVYAPEEEAALEAWPDERQRLHENDRCAIGTYLKNPLNVFIESPWSWRTA